MLTQRQSGLEVVGSFYYLHETDIAKARLDSEGIESWILDEHQIRQRWHMAGALGGVKLAVRPDDALRAREILGEDHSAALAELPESDLPPHADESCPACGGAPVTESTEQQLPGPLQWARSLAFLVLGLLAPRRRFAVTRTCGSCGGRWTTRESR